MPIDESVVGRSYPPTRTYAVTEGKLREFAQATGDSGDNVTTAPPTFPIVLAFAAMQEFLDAEGIALHHIVHGEQGFAYERPIVAGDELTAHLQVTSVRSIGGNDIIATASEIRDASGSLVCTTTATLVHRSAEGQAS